MFQYILFDLDGTLTDPKVGITRSVQYALAAAGIDEPDLDKLEPFIGPPLKESFEEFYHMNEEQALEAVEKYRERFNVTGIFENEMIPGIAQLLETLKAQGKILSIASSKPTVLVERILVHFDIRRYFDYVVGSELDGRRTKKEEVVEEALLQMLPESLYQAVIAQKERQEEATEYKQQIAMVGDRRFDIEGAKAYGLTGIGVSFGYAQEQELERAGADVIADTVEQLQELLLKE